jgi:hypothetical protein
MSRLVDTCLLLVSWFFLYVIIQSHEELKIYHCLVPLPNPNFQYPIFVACSESGIFMTILIYRIIVQESVKNYFGYFILTLVHVGTIVGYFIAFIAWCLVLHYYTCSVSTWHFQAFYIGFLSITRAILWLIHVHYK